MKTKDIKTGETYARGLSRLVNKTPVVVLSTGATRRNGVRGRDDIRNDGVRVRVADGREFTIPSREIAEPWASYEARRAAVAARVAEYREQEKAERQSVADMIAALDSAGVTAARCAGMGIVVPFESFEAMHDLIRDALRTPRKKPSVL